jgi:hypothetical protein
MSHPLLTEGQHRCPAHPDRTPSLSVTQAEDGRWLLHCFAGCHPDEILAAAGLGWLDLFPDAPEVSNILPLHRLDETTEARERVHRRAAQAAKMREHYQPYWDACDQLRAMRHRVRIARTLATRLGETSGAWELLDYAARLETQARNLEMGLENLLLEGRI